MKINYDLKVYPNPVINVMAINVLDIKESSSLYLLDSLGHLVWSTRIGENFEKYYLDINKLPIKGGTYQLVINSDTYLGTKNIILLK